MEAVCHDWSDAMTKTIRVDTQRSPKQDDFMLRLKSLELAMKEATDAYWNMKKDCPHAISYSVNTRWGQGECWCTICGTDFGHYCPDSPDHACHYYTEDGLHVKLNTGEVIQKPIEPIDPEWNPVTVRQDCRKWETDDCCLFCGAPRERK